MVASGRVALRPLAAAPLAWEPGRRPRATTPTPPEGTGSSTPRQPRRTHAPQSVPADPEAMAWRLAARLANVPSATIATPRTRGH
jgi:hypothetical protein